MTQLHNLDSHEAQELVDKNNPTPREEMNEILAAAFTFIWAATECCKKANVKIDFAHITSEDVAFSADGFSFIRQLDTTVDAEWCNSQLAALVKHLEDNAAKRADKIRANIARLQDELAKVEGRV